MLYEKQKATEANEMNYGFIPEDEEPLHPYDTTNPHYEPYEHDYSKYPESNHRV